MEDLARFLLGIIGAAMIVGILGSFPFGDTTRKLVRLLSGLMLTLALLRPAISFDWEQLIAANLLEEGEAIAVQGEAITRENQRAIIKSQVEAYILDKAAAYEALLDARVELSDEDVPISVTLTGTITPYAKARLSETIAQDLGIAKEYQQWKN